MQNLTISFSRSRDIIETSQFTVGHVTLTTTLGDDSLHAWKLITLSSAVPEIWYFHILYRFWYIAEMLVKNRQFQPAPPIVWTLWNFADILSIRKLWSPWIIVWRYLRDHMFIAVLVQLHCRLVTDRRTHGRTDRQTTTAYTALT